MKNKRQSLNSNDALIDKFFKMEQINYLFEIGDKKTPYWDILRLHIYLRFYYPENELSNLLNVQNKRAIDYLHLFLKLIGSIFYLFTQQGNYIFLTISRAVDDDGKYFDKVADSVLKAYTNNRFVVEVTPRQPMNYRTYSTFLGFFSRFFKVSSLPLDVYDKINLALTKYLGRQIITYYELNNVYRTYQYELKYYTWLFKLKKAKKIFISRGNEKGAMQAGRNLNLQVVELQHAAFEFDNILYAYPDFVKASDNLIMPDLLLTFGDYWGKVMHIPVKQIIPIGNDHLAKTHPAICDNSILIVSTIIHGEELSRLTKTLATLYPSLKFIFKLHINEFNKFEHYQSIFNDHKNIMVIKNEFSVDLLIAKSQLVILIISTVLYEALNQNKKVAIYKRLNYNSQKNTFNLPNVFLFEDANGIKEIITTPLIKNRTNFFRPLNISILENLLANDFKFNCSTNSN